MRLCYALAVTAFALHIFGAATNARAQESEIDCASFIKNPDGSWVVIQKVYIPKQKVRVNEGVIFRPNETFLGDDMTARLDKACPNQPVVTPEAAPGQPQQTQVPQIPLSNYADGNGTIDVRRLTCAHLTATSAADADLLLAWYSGWYNGAAKMRGINLARVRYAMSNVANYCKANPDKRLTEVMDLMLK